MQTSFICPLSNRGFIKLQGSDIKKFLQPLITNDIDKVTSDKAIYSAILTPQGKYLFDFFIYFLEDAFFIDCHLEQLEELISKLNFYKLRSDVNFTDVTRSYSFFLLENSDIFENFDLNKHPGLVKKSNGYFLISDPRLKKLGVRAIINKGEESELLKKLQLPIKTIEDIEEIRISNGVPLGTKDMSKKFILECNLDFLNGIDFKKGCYIGQELTSRMKLRNKVTKRLLPAIIDKETINENLKIEFNKKIIGEICSINKNKALCFVNLKDIKPEYLSDNHLVCNQEKVKLYIPEWLKL